MRKVEKFIIPLAAGLLLLSACSRNPMQMSSPYLRGYQSAQSYSQSGYQPYYQSNYRYATPYGMQSNPSAALPLVGVEGIATGDNLKVKGPFFTSGKGKVHSLNPDNFKIEFEIAGHHLIVDATRLDAEKVRFITVDVKAGRTVEAIGIYRRTGNVTVFDMGPGGEVEKLTVRPIKPGNFETDVVQPGRLFPSDSRGTNTLKFFKE
ncbi:MAG: hypothetical protein ACAI44_04275 [Candidatus Sericytochromatia bacterium]